MLRPSDRLLGSQFEIPRSIQALNQTMPYPNTLAFIDLPTDEVTAAHEFCSTVFDRAAEEARRTFGGQPAPNDWTVA